MSSEPEYDRTISLKHCSIRVVIQSGLIRVWHNDSEVASRRGDVGLLIFNVQEEGQPVVYDIAVLQSGYIRIFVGRNGTLVYSDDPVIKPASGQV